MIGELLIEPVIYVIVHFFFWGILLPVSFVLATPIFLVRAAINPRCFFSGLGRDYRMLLVWWLDHRPFQE